MPLKLNYSFTLVFLLVFSQLFSQGVNGSGAEKPFPESLSFSYEGKELVLTKTGTSTRKTFFDTVYRIASFIENPETIQKKDLFDSILDSKNAKQLTIEWAKSYREGKVREVIRDSLGRVTSNVAEIVKFSDFFSAVRMGDRHHIRWLPNGTVTVIFQGEERGKMDTPSFAKTLWSVWFGKYSVVDRKELVSSIEK